jgi:hypothetical protein
MIKNELMTTRTYVETTYAESLGATPSELKAEGWALDWAPASCGGFQYLVGEPCFAGAGPHLLFAPVALVSAAGQVTWLNG